MAITCASYFVRYNIWVSDFWLKMEHEYPLIRIFIRIIILGAHLVRPIRTNPDNFCDHSEISCRKNPTFNAQFVVEVVDDFRVLKLAAKAGIKLASF